MNPAGCAWGESRPTGPGWMTARIPVEEKGAGPAIPEDMVYHRLRFLADGDAL